MEEKDKNQEESDRRGILRAECASSNRERETAARQADQLLLSGGSQWSWLYGRGHFTSSTFSTLFKRKGKPC